MLLRLNGAGSPDWRRLADIVDVRVWGGPTRVPFWPQLVADVFDAPVRSEPNPHTGLLGAAILAAVGTGLHGSVDEAVDAMLQPTRTVHPEPACAKTYQRSYQDFVEACRTD